VLEGDVPSPFNPPEACRFHPRCPRFVAGRCDVETPALIQHGAATHLARCHFPLETWPLNEAEMRNIGSAAPPVAAS
jgi:ABC-type antimicrobial peptide transport system ATPase subunit